jgi:hypothetical protein
LGRKGSNKPKNISKRRERGEFGFKTVYLFMQEDVEEKEEGRKKFERKKRVAGKEENGK